jgi:FkbM family methyltransferase
VSVQPGSAALSRLVALLPDAIFAAAIARSYHRFEPELRRLADFCPEHGTAIDVGAWYGPWSRALARRVDSVVAVEANPAVSGVLRRTVPANVRVVPAAITDRPGEVRLSVPPTGRGTEGTATIRNGDDPGAITVAATTIDELGLRDVTMIKLDVEGAELPALRGAESTLDKYRPVLLIELEYRHGPVDEVIAYLAEFGYQGQVLLGSTWHPVDRFDLAGHQSRVAPLIRGYLPTVLRGGPRYVNNVLFRA